MAESKQFKVVATESIKEGTKHRVQLEIHQLTPERYTALVNGEPTPGTRNVFKPVYIKNVMLNDVQAATIRTAAQALITEFKAINRPRPSAGFSSYEEEFDRP